MDGVNLGLDTGQLYVTPILLRGALLGGSSGYLVQSSAFACSTCDVLAELGSANAQSSSEAPFGSGQVKKQLKGAKQLVDQASLGIE